MNNRKIFMRLLPYLTALGLFIALDMLYFAPQYEGKQLQMHDVTQYQGMSKDILDYKEKYGTDPQWTGNMFGGMPAYLIAVRYPTTLVKYASEAMNFLGDPACLIFIAMTGFFVMLLLCGINPWIGIVPSLAYGLSTYFFIIIGAGHITKMVALAWAPMMVGAVFYTYRRNMWLGAALTALFASVELAANHPQITYYFLLVLIAFWINEAIGSFRQKTLPRFAKATGLLALAAVLAAGSNLAPLWYVQQHSGDTIRGGTELTQSGSESAPKKQGSGLDLDYATAWSYGKAESFNLFIPDLMGGASDRGFSDDGPVAQTLSKYGARSLAAQLPGYWGDQPITAGPTYIGAVIIFLCVLGLFLLRGRCKWWIVAITVLALLLSWGRNMMWFTELFFHYFPGYNKFRTVSMILVIAEWSVPFVAALLLGKLWNQEIERPRMLKAIKYTLIVTGGLALLFALGGGSLFRFGEENTYGMMMQMAGNNEKVAGELTAAIVQERADMLRADSLRSLLFVLLTGGTMLVYALGKLRRGWLVAILAVLVCADLVPVNLRYLPQSKFVEPRKTEIKPTEADLQILADTTPGYRVANFTVSPFNDATTSYFHRSVGGYHGAKLQRYQDLIDRHLSQMHGEVYDMLNTKYFIVPGQDGKPSVQSNPEANGAAWFVSDIEWATTADEEIAALDSHDTKTTAVADIRFRPQVEKEQEGTRLTADSAATITLTDYRPNRLTYTYRSGAKGLAVFSEIYYDKGWTVTLDGRPADYFRADYLLRAMVLPAGEHTVVFSFRAPNFDLLSNITLVFSLLIFAGVAAAAGWTIVRKRRQTAGTVAPGNEEDFLRDSKQR